MKVRWIGGVGGNDCQDAGATRHSDTGNLKAEGLGQVRTASTHYTNSDFEHQDRRCNRGVRQHSIPCEESPQVAGRPDCTRNGTFACRRCSAARPRPAIPSRGGRRRRGGLFSRRLCEGRTSSLFSVDHATHPAVRVKGPIRKISERRCAAAGPRCRRGLRFVGLSMRPSL